MYLYLFLLVLLEFCLLGDWTKVECVIVKVHFCGAGMIRDAKLMKKLSVYIVYVYWWPTNRLTSHIGKFQMAIMCNGSSDSHHVWIFGSKVQLSGSVDWIALLPNPVFCQPPYSHISAQVIWSTLSVTASGCIIQQEIGDLEYFATVWRQSNDRAALNEQRRK